MPCLPRPRGTSNWNRGSHRQHLAVRLLCRGQLGTGKRGAEGLSQVEVGDVAPHRALIETVSPIEGDHARDGSIDAKHGGEFVRGQSTHLRTTACRTRFEFLDADELPADRPCNPVRVVDPETSIDPGRHSLRLLASGNPAELLFYELGERARRTCGGPWIPRSPKVLNADPAQPLDVRHGRLGFAYADGAGPLSPAIELVCHGAKGSAAQTLHELDTSGHQLPHADITSPAFSCPSCTPCTVCSTTVECLRTATSAGLPRFRLWTWAGSQAECRGFDPHHPLHIPAPSRAAARASPTAPGPRAPSAATTP